MQLPGISPTIPATEAPTDLSRARLAIVVGNQVMSVPAEGIGNAFGFQPLDSDLTAIAALTTTTYGRSLLTSVSTAALFASIKQAASETDTGVVELATMTEAQTGTDTSRAVTPAGLRASTRELLLANRTYYVRTDGSDSNTGLVDSAGGGFLTIQKAIDVIKTLDLGGFAITIQVRSGTYTGSIAVATPFFGGSVTLTGDTTTPANCIISHSAYGAFNISNGAILNLQGLQIQNSAASSLGNGVLVQNNAVLNISGNMRFAACTRAHFEINTGATVNLNAGYTISGATNYHWLLNYGAIVLSGQTITITGTPAWGVSFIDASNGAGATVFSATFSGAATGKRYNSTLNAVINTFGGGANYFPGNVAGTATTGLYA